MHSQELALRLDLILVPFDVDSETTPLARSAVEIAEAGLIKRLQDRYDLRVRRVGTRAYDDKNMTVAGVARATARRVSRAASTGRLPVVLSGGCLTAIGVLLGLNRSGPDVTAVWIDAHGDFNTPESTPSGYWDGMALAAVCGRSLTDIYHMMEYAPLELRRVVHVGVRDLDPDERAYFKRCRVSSYPPETVAAGFPADLVERLSTETIYLHIDLDGLDPRDAPAVRLPVADGLRLDQLTADLSRLPRPRALTLSGMSTEGATAEDVQQQIDACLQLIDAAAQQQLGSSAA